MDYAERMRACQVSIFLKGTDGRADRTQEWDTEKIATATGVGRKSVCWPCIIMATLTSANRENARTLTDEQRIRIGEKWCPFVHEATHQGPGGKHIMVPQLTASMLRGQDFRCP